MDVSENNSPHGKNEIIIQKLTKAKEFKLKGNTHFKQQQVKKAIQSYHSGLMYMKGIEQDMNPNKFLGRYKSPTMLPQNLKDEVTAVFVDLSNNIAACLLKQEPVRYERVIECCKEVTELQPENEKGWYRLGLAHYHLQDYDAAKEALKEANRIADGRNAAVKTLISLVDQELKKDNKKFSDMFRNSLLVKGT
ncbi:tetratricopeptide repeat protein 9C-like [Homarus americanus]|uniref:Tetratricopeptide repeat protein 9C-like n=1 Tax=Homarus americanus TaxID=6706 RepID=A0A8J5JS51_HOMAM|nr:tetratricopeptide repeat protein 9C-like [Homarus americanus]XP_042231861.1 tetratricopeptide repeat protein 9C-like [Homarus americanus]KAG7163231.1 Tetratricopeptide repeat protein 9C-like [Homarus americanus]